MTFRNAHAGLLTLLVAASVAIGCGDDGSSDGSGGATSDSGDRETGDSDGGTSSADPGENCPSSQPLDGGDCAEGDYPDDCSYDSAVCECTDRGWSCEIELACPTEQPTDGADCEEPGQDCSFDDADCRCTRDGWACSIAADCPADQPATGSDCDAVDDFCLYDEANCICTDAGWECNPTGQQNATCPETQPTSGETCEVTMGMDACDYDSGAVTCVCPMSGMGGPGGAVESEWVCGSCPTDQPTTGDTCEAEDLACEFTDADCNCMDNGGDLAWVCR